VCACHLRSQPLSHLLWLFHHLHPFKCSNIYYTKGEGIMSTCPIILLICSDAQSL
jgi:hypothetical protein